MGTQEPQQPYGHVLIVEPETLLLWSLSTYLQKWYTVHAACAETAAMQILDRHRIDAVVVSDELPENAADRIGARARDANEAVVSVRTVVGLLGVDDTTPDKTGTLSIVKPFRLSELAGLLGVVFTTANVQA